MSSPGGIELFKRIAPQKAQDGSGYIVQVGGRYSVQYIERNNTFEVDADMLCEVVPIYYETLRVRKADGSPIIPSLVDTQMAMNQIKDGLNCLGIKYEFCKGSS